MKDLAKEEGATGERERGRGSSQLHKRDKTGREEERRIITIGPIPLPVPWGRKTKRREYVEQVQVSTIQSRVGRWGD